MVASISTIKSIFVLSVNPSTKYSTETSKLLVFSLCKDIDPEILTLAVKQSKPK